MATEDIGRQEKVELLEMHIKDLYAEVRKAQQAGDNHAVSDASVKILQARHRIAIITGKGDL